MNRQLIFLAVLSLFIIQVHAQDQTPGKRIIKGYGDTYAVVNPDIKTDTTAQLKVIFDVSQSATDKAIMNKYIETAARFLNMHASEGMQAEQLSVAMTIHGGAWQDILTNKAYKERFGTNNPNAKLIELLSEAGVDVILCGQTAEFRQIKADEIIPEVKLALSAMTALLQYQEMGYRFIKF